MNLVNLSGLGSSVALDISAALVNSPAQERASAV